MDKMNKIAFWMSSFVAWVFFGLSVLAFAALLIGLYGADEFSGSVLGTSVALFVSGIFALLFYGCAKQKLAAHCFLLVFSGFLVPFDVMYVYLLGVSIIVASPCIIFFLNLIFRKHIASQSG